MGSAMRQRPAQRLRELDVNRRGIDQDDVGVVALPEDAMDGRGHGPGHEVAEPRRSRTSKSSAHQEDDSAARCPGPRRGAAAVMMDAMSVFDQKAQDWDTPERQERAAAIADIIRAHVPLSRSMRAIDIGAGTGLLGLELAADVGAWSWRSRRRACWRWPGRSWPPMGQAT